MSSHCIEHQPDLIRHLRQVSELLRPGGKYYLFVPDKRYCFDHFLPCTHVGSVLQAHLEKRLVHTLESVVEHSVLVTHNSCIKHWQGFHMHDGYAENRAPRIQAAIDEYKAADGGYFDAHAWQFIPESFNQLMVNLFETGMIDLRPEIVCETPRKKIEFTAILSRPAELSWAPPPDR